LRSFKNLKLRAELAKSLGSRNPRVLMHSSQEEFARFDTAKGQENF